MASSCSHWWHAPFYCIASLILALIAMTSTPPPTTPATTLSPNQTLPLSLSATAALRSHNFTIIATLLQLSPDLFFPNNNPQTTIFAIHDNAISNLSTVPPFALKLLLQFHTLPRKLSFQELIDLPISSCLATQIPFKSVALTQINPQNRLVQINNVTVSHPDLFLDDFVAIHGVLAPFTPLNMVEIHSGRDFIHSPPCKLLNWSTGLVNSTRRPEMWVRMIRVLSSNGFVSFAVGLNSVLDGILADYPDLSRVTVFAPPEFQFVGSSSDPLLDRVVRYHVLGHRYSFLELASLPEKAMLMTLLKDEVLEISESVNGTQVLAINGVDVASPDVFTSEMFVIHGISRAFDFHDHANI